MPGPSEWVIIAIVAIVVIFGAKKIPEIARSMGRAQSEFKQGMKEGADDVDETSAAQPPAQAQAQPPQAQPQPPQAQPPQAQPQPPQAQPPQAQPPQAQPQPPQAQPPGQSEGQSSG